MSAQRLVCLRHDAANIPSREVSEARPPRRVFGIVGHLEPPPEIINELQLGERRDATAVKPLADGAGSYAEQACGNFNSARVLGMMSSGGSKAIRSDSVTGVIKEIGV